MSSSGEPSKFFKPVFFCKKIAKIRYFSKFSWLELSTTMPPEANTEDDLEVDPANLKIEDVLDDNHDHDEEAKVEAWLDEHPEFFQEYLIRKGKHLH